jgi:formylmethanofuran dehydrogenase subunit E
MTNNDSPKEKAITEPLAWSLALWIKEATLPNFAVLDTRSAQGRLDPRVKRVDVADLVLAHGHACDGLLRGAWAMRALADLAFGDAPIDRSDLLVVSKNSPCLGDVASYLTGGRARFGTHRLNDTLGVGFQLQRLSTGEAWEVREEPGFFPAHIIAWEAALLRDGRDESEMRELLAVHEAAQWDWVRDVLFASAPREHYLARTLDHLELPAPLHVARRTDTVNRLVPVPLDVPSPDDPTSTPVHGDGNGETLRQWQRRYDEGPDSST